MIGFKEVRTWNKHDSIEFIICNKCGENIDEQNWRMGSGINIKLTGGYASKIIDSICGEYFTFDLCDYCLIKFMGEFKIPKEYKKK